MKHVCEGNATTTGNYKLCQVFDNKPNLEFPLGALSDTERVSFY